MKRLTLSLIAMFVLVFNLPMWFGPSPSSAQDVLPAELAPLRDAGAVITMLAGETIGESPDGNQALTLSRVVPMSDDELPIVIAGGQELWYVESGTLILSGDSGAEITANAGEQALVSEPGQYTVSFEGENCPSAIRLEFSSVIAMRLSSDEAGPELGPDGVPCPRGGVLLETPESISKRPVPAFGFIARLTLAPELFLAPPPYSGPVGYSVERGSFTLSGPPTLSMGLTAGSWVALASGQEHWISLNGAEQTEVLMVGALASDDDGPQIAPTPTPVAGVTGSSYLSPTYGYRVSWTESWIVAAESSDAGVDSLQLTNGVSQLYFQSYDAFVGEAISCVDGIASELPNQQGFTNVRPRETADGKPILTGDAQKRIGVFNFTYTNDSGAFEYTESIECRMLPRPESVLVITQIVLAESYSTEIVPVRDILATLDLDG